MNPWGRVAVWAATVAASILCWVLLGVVLVAVLPPLWDAVTGWLRTDQGVTASLVALAVLVAVLTRGNRQPPGGTPGGPG